MAHPNPVQKAPHLTTGKTYSNKPIPSERDVDLVVVVRRYIAEMARINTENKCLRYKLDLLYRSIGSSFTLFPSLPSAIRRQIWRYALIGPHIDVISSRMATRSRIIEIVQMCKEAYEQGISLHFSYFTFCDYSSWEDNNYHASFPKHYMNPDADMVWILGDHTASYFHKLLPTSMAVYDGRPAYRKMKTLVIDHKLWTDPFYWRNSFHSGDITHEPL